MDIDAIKKRYAETAQETDTFGRSIVVGRLKPSQQLAAGEMGMNDSAAQTIRYVCMLRSIDADDFAFPKSRGEVNARIDRLDEEGIEALVRAVGKLFGVDTGSDGAVSTGESAKNSSRAQGSAKPSGS